MPSPAMNGWHLDKRVPIALILALVLQAATAIWWASQMSTRVDVLEDWVTDNKLVAERLSRIETRQEYVIRTIDRIDSKLAGEP